LKTFILVHITLIRHHLQKFKSQISNQTGWPLPAGSAVPAPSQDTTKIPQWLLKI